jgi:hypothetical protein
MVQKSCKNAGCLGALEVRRFASYSQARNLLEVRCSALFCTFLHFSAPVPGARWETLNRQPREGIRHLIPAPIEAEREWSRKKARQGCGTGNGILVLELCMAAIARGKTRASCMGLRDHRGARRNGPSPATRGWRTLWRHILFTSGFESKHTLFGGAVKGCASFFSCIIQYTHSVSGFGMFFILFHIMSCRLGVRRERGKALRAKEQM